MSSSQFHEVRLGNNLTLTCDFDGVPTTTIQWLHNGTIVSNDTDGVVIRDYSGSSHLMLTDLHRNAVGFYACNASNVVQTSQVQFTVLIEGNDHTQLLNVQLIAQNTL